MSYEPLTTSEAQGNVYGDVEYKLRVTFGATGAVSSYRGKDVVSFVRNSTGNYTLTLPCPYNEISSFDVGQLLASGTPLLPVITTDNTATANVIIEFRNTSGTATDPASGSIAYITLGVTKDSLNNKFVGP